MTDTNAQSQSNWQWPSEIEIKSDGNVLRFVEVLPKLKHHKEPYAQYVITESVTNEGKPVTLSQSQVQRMIHVNS